MKGTTEANKVLRNEKRKSKSSKNLINKFMVVDSE